jgi:hypothetical protein
MNEVLERRFAEMGARLSLPERPWRGAPRIDVRSDRRGEFFDIGFGRGNAGTEVEVVDVQSRDRHLLLLVRQGTRKSKFLCGHDERHWFVAAVPESERGVSGVAQAMVALQPESVREAVARKKPKHPLERKNTAYLRQGEWFFVPTPGLDVEPDAVLHDEPITRGRGNPHIVELLARHGGELVYVGGRYSSGLTEAEFAKLSEVRVRNNAPWRQMVRDALVYARGTVRHPDHATIVLHTWHRVEMNTEQRARAMRHVAFLD